VLQRVRGDELRRAAQVPAPRLARLGLAEAKPALRSDADDLLGGLEVHLEPLRVVRDRSGPAPAVTFVVETAAPGSAPEQLLRGRAELGVRHGASAHARGLLDPDAVELEAEGPVLALTAALVAPRRDHETHEAGGHGATAVGAAHHVRHRVHRVHVGGPEAPNAAPAAAVERHLEAVRRRPARGHAVSLRGGAARGEAPNQRATLELDREVLRAALGAPLRQVGAPAPRAAKASARGRAAGEGGGRKQLVVGDGLALEPERGARAPPKDLGAQQRRPAHPRQRPEPHEARHARRHGMLSLGRTIRAVAKVTQAIGRERHDYEPLGAPGVGAPGHGHRVAPRQPVQRR